MPAVLPSSLRSRLTPRAATVLVAILGVALRLTFLAKPMSSDEAGYLMVGGQWSPGHSLYGDFWVDRPPLLVGLFQLAHVLGGPIALRFLGIACLLVTTAAAAGIGRLATDWRWASPLASAVPALLLSDTLYGSLNVDGELLAVPFVTVGLYAVLRGLAEPARTWRRTVLWLAAGLLAVAAAAVKQNMVDVAVAAGIGVVWLAWRRRWGLAVHDTLVFAVGALGGGAAVVGWADAHGTRPGPLWDAVVTFRGAASRVISEEASSDVHHQALLLVGSFVLSGGWGIGVLAAVALARRLRTPLPTDPAPTPLGWIALGVAGWETVGVVVGGSYWLHYLTGTVPGSVLLLAAALRTRRVRLRWVLAVLGYVAATTLPATIITSQLVQSADDVQVARYLRAHAHPGETGVVAFGHTNVFEGTGLTVPYDNLWSLPVRVRDPHLVDFTRVLREDRPTWLVVDGPRIDTWAIDAHSANAVIARDYRVVTQLGDWYVFRARSVG
ncbi:hypothetical protein GCM10028801_23650 [Nocardioides maradonensis]